MGGVSSTLAESYNKVVQQMTNTCTQTTTINQDTTCRVIANNCGHVNVTCENTAKVYQHCSLQQTSSIAQTAISQSVSTASAGVWGFAVSSATGISSNLVQNVLTQACANTVIVNQVMSSNNTTVCNGTASFDVNFLSSYTGSQVCLAQQTAKTTQTAASTAKATAIGLDPTELLIVIAVCGTLLIGAFIAVGGWCFTSLNPLAGGGGGGGSKTSVQVAAAPAAAASKTGGIRRARYTAKLL